MNYVLSYVRRQFQDVLIVDTTTLSAWLENKNVVTILADCRRQDEFEVSHIPGAERIPFNCTEEELKVN
jgi:rhodanese-related sulfurtransferase